MLTYIATNELHYRIDEQGYQEDIKINATIYDAIYITIKKDSSIIKWLNDNIIEIMTKDFIEDQIVHNEATGEIGINWTDLVQIPNGASKEDIDKIIKGSNGV